MLLNELPFVMIRCLLVTIIIEVIGSIILGIRTKKDILNVVLVNIITNPIVVTIPVWFNINCGILERNVCLFILELWAFLLEAFLYKKYLSFKKINPYVVSIVLNLCSYLIGEIINYLV